MSEPDRTRAIEGGSRWGPIVLGVITWLIAALFFFPVFWMVLNGFKTEDVANASPVLFFEPTMEQYTKVTSGTPGLLNFTDAFDGITVFAPMPV